MSYPWLVSILSLNFSMYLFILSLIFPIHEDFLRDLKVQFENDFLWLVPYLRPHNIIYHNTQAKIHQN